jgi:AraC family L-rhamnose operon regulatory protein RhaS
MKKLTTYARNFEYELPMQCYEGHSLDNTEALDFRFSIVLIEKGSGFLSIDGKSLFYMAPCVLCINEKEHIIIDENEELELKVFYFHPHIINSSLDFVTIRELPENCSLTLFQDSYWKKFFIYRDANFFGKISVGPLTAKRLSLFLSKINREITEQCRDSWPCRSRSFLMEILFTLDNVSIEEISLEEPLLCQVKEEFCPVLLYIYNNYEQKLTVDDISKKFSINRTSLSKMFQDNVNESFITYLNKLRVFIASQLLRDTTLPISEIMFRVGMNDPAHFLRTFKRYMNLSPSDYRKKYCWML